MTGQEQLNEFSAFTRDVLLPCAMESLARRYKAYCEGGDAGVEIKRDSTPAGAADRETELALRALIAERWPDHGIWGEEFGPTHTDREWVWILDPLDGTKEFLAKNPGGFGTLIGLLHDGVPALGATADPLDGRIWLQTMGKDGARPESRARASSLEECVIACTNPGVMFPSGARKAAIEELQARAKDFRPKLNCIGFAEITSGVVDIVVEGGFKIHDLAALIPVLCKAGHTIIDFDGVSYATRRFDLSTAGEKTYDAIAAADADLARQALDVIRRHENQARRIG